MTFVPEVAGTLRGNQQQSDLPSNGRAFVAEVAPTLQTQQRRVDVDNALGLIIGTSAEGGEGFTLTSSNLGKTVNNQTPLLAFDPTQVTHPENRSSCAGDSAALAKSARPPHIAYSCITGDVTHALLSEGADASEDGSGRGTPIVAPTLEATDGEKWGSNQWVDKSVELLNAQAELGWKVRRLTPRECERLQDFPDDWTLVPGASDSTRYAALGNSMAVCVMRWIGRRIGLVDSILFGGAA
jgi:DNA (cytosine-5)-methyltransferase 1